MLWYSYHFIKTNFVFPRSDFVIVGSLPQFYLIYGPFFFSRQETGGEKGKWEQDTPPKVLILY